MLGNTTETSIQRRVVFLKNREIPRAEGGINEERKAVGCCLRPRSVQKANQPQGQFLAYGKRNLTICQGNLPDSFRTQRCGGRTADWQRNIHEGYLSWIAPRKKRMGLADNNNNTFISYTFTLLRFHLFVIQRFEPSIFGVFRVYLWVYECKSFRNKWVCKGMNLLEEQQGVKADTLTKNTPIHPKIHPKYTQ